MRRDSTVRTVLTDTPDSPTALVLYGAVQGGRDQPRPAGVVNDGDSPAERTHPLVDLAARVYARRRDDVLPGGSPVLSVRQLHPAGGADEVDVEAARGADGRQQARQVGVCPGPPAVAKVGVEIAAAQPAARRPHDQGEAGGVAPGQRPNLPAAQATRLQG